MLILQFILNLPQLYLNKLEYSRRMNTTQQQLIASYSNQLANRFYPNSMALEVLICLLLIVVLVVEIVKFAKKSYEWETEHEISL